MATATAPKVENPTDLNLTPPSADDVSSIKEPPSPGGDDAGRKGVQDAVAVKSGDGDGGDAVTDIQKKMKRAERFGMAVHLSEREKRNSRAERFGISPSAPADEEVKKKARLSRFGSSSVTDSAEEDKKKARALRFSQPASSVKANGEENVEKTVVAGKAGEGT